MERTRSMLVLAATMAVVALTGFAFDSGITPEPLQAQSGCGAFRGMMCQSDCTRECSNGSCCSWSYYYYSEPL
jgi:hypothetical protein